MFGERHTRSAYSMGVRYTLVLHCNVHVYSAPQLRTVHTLSPTHWRVIAKMA